MRPPRRCRTKVIAAALATVVAAPAWADEAQDLKDLTTLQSQASAGFGMVDKDNRRFGQYSGLNREGGYLLLDADVVRRDDATGTWLRITGRDLGLFSRSLRFEHSRQGDWGYFIDFSQTPRNSPHLVRSNLEGAGTASQRVIVVPAGTGAPQEFGTRRDAIGLGLDKALGRGWDVQVRFRNEEKQGERLFGQGDTAGTNVRFLTDPIDYTTRQIDATASYTDERLQLSGGYYGTDFQNRNVSLTVANGVAGLSPMALPPGNQSHQYHVTGGYNLTQTMRATFKVAAGTIRQTDSFPVAPTTVNRSTLDGRVDTRLFQVGLSARPLPRLSILASYRTDDRDDKTPVDRYLVTGVAATSTFDGTNEPRSIRTTASKLEGTYQLPAGIRATLGTDYEEKKRNQYRVRSVSSREETEETTYRGELRRALGETITGSLSLARSTRTGSPFFFNVTNNNGAGSNKIAPLHLADRQRDKLGTTLGWTPTDALGLQFRAAWARDDYEQRNFEDLGLRHGRAALYSLDGSYRISDAWDATAFVSRADNMARQVLCASPTTGGNCTGQQWAGDVSNMSDSFGAGLSGKARANLKVGADLTHSRFRDSFGLVALTGAPITALPDVSTRVTTLKLFGDYALHKTASLRVQYVHDRYRTDDWTWANWTYSDGTRISEEPRQVVNFIGIAYTQRFY